MSKSESEAQHHFAFFPAATLIVFLVSLIQECFNSPYGTGFFPTYAERIPGESSQLLSEAAKENKVYLVGGRTAVAN